ncbi:MAG: rRNA maturation RNase YbeY [Cyclobacteriaceae bacterium]|nr:rRNA maturation RNase YbeY [Cyclobacteriaceae bacterium]
MNIEFFYEDTDFVLNQPDTYAKWIALITNKEGYTIEALNYIFCSDEYLYQMNMEYLGHDTYTDIITFDNSEEENTIESDIFISVNRVKENSAVQNIPFENELARVLIHGVLHLMGWNDKTDEERKRMREKEDASLSLR